MKKKPIDRKQYWRTYRQEERNRKTDLKLLSAYIPIELMDKINQYKNNNSITKKEAVMELIEKGLKVKK